MSSPTKRTDVETFDLAGVLTDVARDLAARSTTVQMLDIIVAAARASLPGIDHAGISLVAPDGSISTSAATDAFVRDLDSLQYDVGQGPCLQAMRDGNTVRVENARSEQRWPLFITPAVELGLRSQLGLHLGDDGATYGALNLYSTSADTLDDELPAMAEMFAVHAAIALGRVRVQEQLQTGLASRTDIGQAMGILMERYRLDRDGAFAFLIRVSTTSNRKLRDIATQVVVDAERQSSPTKP